MTFSRDELMTAILEAQRRPNETPNSLTTSELAELMDCGYDRARRVLREAEKVGVVRVGWVRRVSKLGVARQYEGYVLVEPEAN